VISSYSILFLDRIYRIYWILFRRGRNPLSRKNQILFQTGFTGFTGFLFAGGEIRLRGKPNAFSDRIYWIYWILFAGGEIRLRGKTKCFLTPVPSSGATPVKWTLPFTIVNFTGHCGAGRIYWIDWIF
jgi:hypothetical protein